MTLKAKRKTFFYFLIIITLSLLVYPSIAVLDTNGIRYQYTTGSTSSINQFFIQLPNYGADSDFLGLEVKLNASDSYTDYDLGSGTTDIKIYQGGSWVDHGDATLTLTGSDPHNGVIIEVTSLDLSGHTGTLNLALTQFALTANTYIVSASTCSGDASPDCPSWGLGSSYGFSSMRWGDIHYAYYPSGYVPYVCDIDVSPSSGYLPLEVTFTDASSGFPEVYPYPEYILDFGDGSSWTGDRQYTGENWFHTYHYAGTYNYSYQITYEGETYYSNGTVTISDAEANYYVEVHGLNTAPIEGANVSIWYNGEYQDSEGSSSIGRAYFTIPPYRFVNGTITKSGYQTAYFDTYIYPSDNLEVVTLYADNETPGTGDSYGNYIVSFKNANTGDEIGYSNIEVYSDSGYTTLFYDEYSNSDGVWTGLLPMNTTYYYKYPETIGYYSQSWSYNLTSSPSYKTVNLVPKSGYTTTTPTPTIITVTPTITAVITYNEGNLSSLNVKERLGNLFVLAGFTSESGFEIVLSMLIILVCTCLVGWITLSGTGAGIGCIIGFVTSLGLGLLPIWLLIAGLFFGGFFVAMKIFSGGSA